MKYLLGAWDNLKEKFADKYVMLFLDFDGTLAPIAETPPEAKLSGETKALLKKMANQPWINLALISGRAIRDIKNKVGLNNVIYSGNHGLEIEGPKIKFALASLEKHKTVIRQIKNDLSRKISSVKGAFIEDKEFSLALHYRLVDKREVPSLKTIFHEAVILYLVRNKIKIKSGKMVLEVRPSLEWDKGKIVLWLLARQKFANKKGQVLPVYIGDDLTDEDAFGVLKNKGITVFVGKPHRSQAQFYLNDTKEVAEFMRRLIALKKA